MERRRATMPGQIRRQPSARPALSEQRPPVPPYIAGSPEAVYQQQYRIAIAPTLPAQIPNRHGAEPATRGADGAAAVEGADIKI